MAERCLIDSGFCGQRVDIANNDRMTLAKLPQNPGIKFRDRSYRRGRYVTDRSRVRDVRVVAFYRKPD
jgi:hypothetical protein